MPPRKRRATPKKKTPEPSPPTPAVVAHAAALAQVGLGIKEVTEYATEEHKEFLLKVSSNSVLRKVEPESYLVSCGDPLFGSLLSSIFSAVGTDNFHDITAMHVKAITDSWRERWKSIEDRYSAAHAGKLYGHEELLPKLRLGRKIDSIESVIFVFNPYRLSHTISRNNKSWTYTTKPLIRIKYYNSLRFQEHRVDPTKQLELPSLVVKLREPGLNLSQTPPLPRFNLRSRKKFPQQTPIQISDDEMDEDDSDKSDDRDESLSDADYFFDQEADLSIELSDDSVNNTQQPQQSRSSQPPPSEPVDTRDAAYWEKMRVETAKIEAMDLDELEDYLEETGEKYLREHPGEEAIKYEYAGLYLLIYNQKLKEAGIEVPEEEKVHPDPMTMNEEEVMDHLALVDAAEEEEYYEKLVARYKELTEMVDTTDLPEIKGVTPPETIESSVEPPKKKKTQPRKKKTSSQVLSISPSPDVISVPDNSELPPSSNEPDKPSPISGLSESDDSQEGQGILDAKTPTPTPTNTPEGIRSGIGYMDPSPFISGTSYGQPSSYVFDVPKSSSSDNTGDDKKDEMDTGDDKKDEMDIEDKSPIVEPSGDKMITITPPEKLPRVFDENTQDPNRAPKEPPLDPEHPAILALVQKENDIQDIKLINHELNRRGLESRAVPDSEYDENVGILKKILPYRSTKAISAVTDVTTSKYLFPPEIRDIERSVLEAVYLLTDLRAGRVDELKNDDSMSKRVQNQLMLYLRHIKRAYLAQLSDASLALLRVYLHNSCLPCRAGLFSAAAQKYIRGHGRKANGQPLAIGGTFYVPPDYVYAKFHRDCDRSWPNRFKLAENMLGLLSYLRNIVHGNDLGNPYEIEKPYSVTVSELDIYRFFDIKHEWGEQKGFIAPSALKTYINNRYKNIIGATEGKLLIDPAVIEYIQALDYVVRQRLIDHVLGHFLSVESRLEKPRPILSAYHLKHFIKSRTTPNIQLLQNEDDQIDLSLLDLQDVIPSTKNIWTMIYKSLDKKGIHEYYAGDDATPEDYSYPQEGDDEYALQYPEEADPTKADIHGLGEPEGITCSDKKEEDLDAGVGIDEVSGDVEKIETYSGALTFYQGVIHFLATLDGLAPLAGDVVLNSGLRNAVDAYIRGLQGIIPSLQDTRAKMKGASRAKELFLVRKLRELEARFVDKARSLAGRFNKFRVQIGKDVSVTKEMLERLKQDMEKKVPITEEKSLELRQARFQNNKLLVDSWIGSFAVHLDYFVSSMDDPELSPYVEKVRRENITERINLKKKIVSDSALKISAIEARTAQEKYDQLLKLVEKLASIFDRRQTNLQDGQEELKKLTGMFGNAQMSEEYAARWLKSVELFSKVNEDYQKGWAYETIKKEIETLKEQARAYTNQTTLEKTALAESLNQKIQGLESQLTTVNESWNLAIEQKMAEIRDLQNQLAVANTNHQLTGQNLTGEVNKKETEIQRLLDELQRTVDDHAVSEKALQDSLDQIKESTTADISARDARIKYLEGQLAAIRATPEAPSLDAIKLKAELDQLRAREIYLLDQDGNPTSSRMKDFLESAQREREDNRRKVFEMEKTIKVLQEIIKTKEGDEDFEYMMETTTPQGAGSKYRGSSASQRDENEDFGEDIFDNPYHVQAVAMTNLELEEKVEILEKEIEKLKVVEEEKVKQQEQILSLVAEIEQLKKSVAEGEDVKLQLAEGLQKYNELQNKHNETISQAGEMFNQAGVEIGALREQLARTREEYNTLTQKMEGARQEYEQLQQNILIQQGIMNNLQLEREQAISNAVLLTYQEMAMIIEGIFTGRAMDFSNQYAFDLYRALQNGIASAAQNAATMGFDTAAAQQLVAKQQELATHYELGMKKAQESNQSAIDRAREEGIQLGKAEVALRSNNPEQVKDVMAKLTASQKMITDLQNNIARLQGKAAAYQGEGESVAVVAPRVEKGQKRVTVVAPHTHLTKTYMTYRGDIEESEAKSMSGDLIAETLNENRGLEAKINELETTITQLNLQISNQQQEHQKLVHELEIARVALQNAPTQEQMQRAQQIESQLSVASDTISSLNSVQLQQKTVIMELKTQLTQLNLQVITEQGRYQKTLEVLTRAANNQDFRSVVDADEKVIDLIEKIISQRKPDAVVTDALVEDFREELESQVGHSGDEADDEELSSSDESSGSGGDNEARRLLGVLNGMQEQGLDQFTSALKANPLRKNNSMDSEPGSISSGSESEGAQIIWDDNNNGFARSTPPVGPANFFSQSSGSDASGSGSVMDFSLPPRQSGLSPDVKNRINTLKRVQLEAYAKLRKPFDTAGVINQIQAEFPYANIVEIEAMVNQIKDQHEKEIKEEARRRSAFTIPLTTNKAWNIGVEDGDEFNAAKRRLDEALDAQERWLQVSANEQRRRDEKNDSSAREGFQIALSSSPYTRGHPIVREVDVNEVNKDGKVYTFLSQPDHLTSAKLFRDTGVLENLTYRTLALLGIRYSDYIQNILLSTDVRKNTEWYMQQLNTLVSTSLVFDKADGDHNTSLLAEREKQLRESKDMIDALEAYDETFKARRVKLLMGHDEKIVMFSVQSIWNEYWVGVIKNLIPTEGKTKITASLAYLGMYPGIFTMIKDQMMASQGLKRSTKLSMFTKSTDGRYELIPELEKLVQIGLNKLDEDQRKGMVELAKKAAGDLSSEAEAGLYMGNLEKSLSDDIEEASLDPHCRADEVLGKEYEKGSHGRENDFPTLYFTKDQMMFLCSGELLYTHNIIKCIASINFMGYQKFWTDLTEDLSENTSLLTTKEYLQVVGDLLMSVLMDGVPKKFGASLLGPEPGFLKIAVCMQKIGQLCASDRSTEDVLKEIGNNVYPYYMGIVMILSVILATNVDELHNNNKLKISAGKSLVKTMTTSMIASIQFGSNAVVTMDHYLNATGFNSASLNMYSGMVMVFLCSRKHDSTKTIDRLCKVLVQGVYGNLRMESIRVYVGESIMLSETLKSIRVSGEGLDDTNMGSQSVSNQLPDLRKALIQKVFTTPEESLPFDVILAGAFNMANYYTGSGSLYRITNRRLVEAMEKTTPKIVTRIWNPQFAAPAAKGRPVVKMGRKVTEQSDFWAAYKKYITTSMKPLELRLVNIIISFLRPLVSKKSAPLLEGNPATLNKHLPYDYRAYHTQVAVLVNKVSVFFEGRPAAIAFDGASQLTRALNEYKRKLDVILKQNFVFPESNVPQEVQTYIRGVYDFLTGDIKDAVTLCDQILIVLPKIVETFKTQPEMKINSVIQQIYDYLRGRGYGYWILNVRQLKSLFYNRIDQARKAFSQHAIEYVLFMRAQKSLPESASLNQKIQLYDANYATRLVTLGKAKGTINWLSFLLDDLESEVKRHPHDDTITSLGHDVYFLLQSIERHNRPDKAVDWDSVIAHYNERSRISEAARNEAMDDSKSGKRKRDEDQDSQLGSGEIRL
jgi:hypothetical protein